jgi:hypothetical protein
MDRRFSLSLPPTLDIPLIPDVIKQEDDDKDDQEENVDLKDSSQFIKFPKCLLQITNKQDTTLYKIPTRAANDARKIWKQAYLPKQAYAYNIESSLIDWAFNYALLEIEGYSIVNIKWFSYSHCRCESNWKAFVNWILCASSSTNPIVVVDDKKLK